MNFMKSLKFEIRNKLLRIQEFKYFDIGLNLVKYFKGNDYLTEFLIKYQTKSNKLFINVLDEFKKLEISENCAKYV